MRPERLELEGFTAFRRHTLVDFTDADLFALSGPTGAGKSSLIDAIVFTLYGTVPRLADRRRVGPVISQGRVEARLGLDFAVGDAHYRAVRVVRTTPSGTASTKEARLERRHPDGSAELLAGDADELTRAVEALLGLTYDHFTTAVVLPQGEFARFLHHRPADRQALLKQLLDLGLYDRLQQQAGQQAKEAAVRAETARARLEELAGADDEHAARLGQQLGAIGGLLDACETARPVLDELAGQLAETTTTARTARRQAELLAGVAKPADVAALAGDHSRSLAELAEAEAGHDTHRAALARAEADLAALPAATDSERVLDAHARLERLQRDVAKGRAAAERQLAAQLAATAAATAATAALAEAEQARQSARTASAAAALAEHLHPGDDCPVCGATVTTLPVAVPHSLAAANDAHRAAAATAAECETARQAAETELARIEAKLEQILGIHDELAAAVAAGPDAATAQAQLAAAQAAAAVVATARQALERHEQRTGQARAAVSRSARAQTRAWARFDEVRDGLAALGPPAATRADLDADWEQLVDWAAGRLTQLHDDAGRLDTVAAEFDARRQAVLDGLRAHAATALADGPDSNPARPAGDLAAIRDAAVAAEARLEAERHRLEADRARATAARADLAAATAAEQVANELARLLRADRFGAWILDEAVQQLVQGATGLLQRLSGGAYSMTLDGKDFAVVDHNNADAVRSARTLSGGETFLASLALALALAEQVVTLAGPTAAPLESLFLDEGFGTLDPDTLDTVATAIEELGSQGRMVGLVTHVRELADRLPVRFEVTKGPDGATVERVLA